MPGKPAARLGDTALDCADPVDTPTGIVVAKGTVFINKLPAAKQGDQIVGVDLHIVMIPAPTGAIPTPLPHPFAGIIDGELESTVKIMGMPAAVVGSTATNTPPHIPQGGAFQKPPANKAKIIVGSPNVFIGTGSGGGGSGGSGSVGGGTDGIFPVSIDTSDVSSEPTEEHYLDMIFDDGEGARVVGPGYHLVDTENKERDGHLSGDLARYGIPEGEGEAGLKDITMLCWSVQNELTPGAAVKLQIETVGMEDGTKVEFKIFERETDQEDKCIRRIDTSKISGNKAEADWTYVLPDKSGAVPPGEGFLKPDYYFTAEACGIKKRAPILDVSADLEIEVKYTGEEGDPVKDEPYLLYLSTGELRKGKTDAGGCIRHKRVPVRDAWITFPNIGLTAAESTKTNQKIVHTIPVGRPNERFAMTPGIPHLIVIKRQTIRIDVLEAEDTLFRYKSAVFLPDGILQADEKDKGNATEEQSKVDGLAVIKGFFHFLNLCALRGEDKYVLITGHTDTVGSDNYNAKLSLMRAEVVLSLIEGGLDGRKRFVDHVSKMNTPEDKQQILKWISKQLSRFDDHQTLMVEDDPKKWNLDPLPKWKDVDPGDIDGQIGPNTNEALRNFKTLFQKKFPPAFGYEGATFSEDLDELKSKLKGAAFDDAVWAAVFEIYQAEIEASLSQYGLALFELRQNIKWVDDTKRAVGCGETWPIDSRGKDNYRSQSNRRVEILFYDPYELKKYSPGKDQDQDNEEKPFLPCKGGRCAKGDCHIFKDIDREKGDHETYEPKLEWRYLPMDEDGFLSLGTLTIQTDIHVDEKQVHSFLLTSNTGYSQLKKSTTDNIGKGEWVSLKFTDLPMNDFYRLIAQVEDDEEVMLMDNIHYRNLSGPSNKQQEDQVQPIPSQMEKV